MPRFVPLPDPTGGPGAASMWINPEHIVSITPQITTDGTHYILHAQLKLVGDPLRQVWLGKFDTAQRASAGWALFLRALGNSGPATPPSLEDDY